MKVAKNHWVLKPWLFGEPFIKDGIVIPASSQLGPLPKRNVLNESPRSETGQEYAIGFAEVKQGLKYDIRGVNRV